MSKGKTSHPERAEKMASAGLATAKTERKKNASALLHAGSSYAVIRWLTRVQAAAYIGVHPSTFDRLRGREHDPVPQPHGPTERLARWCRHELDQWMARRDQPARSGETLPRQPPPALPNAQWR
jgi:predicted DNA-binding transcriptional regulator AlpA